MRTERSQGGHAWGLRTWVVGQITPCYPGNHVPDPSRFCRQLPGLAQQGPRANRISVSGTNQMCLLFLASCMFLFKRFIIPLSEWNQSPHECWGQVVWESSHAWVGAQVRQGAREAANSLLTEGFAQTPDAMLQGQELSSEHWVN